MVNKIKSSVLRVRVRKVASLHYLYVFFLSVQLIAFHAGNLITPEIIMRRWLASALLLTITAIVWYIAKDALGQESTLKKLIAILVVSDIAMASFMVYISRGMASRAVALYFIPILVSAILARRSAILATAAVCIAAYFATAVSYFTLNFNEGYKLELYGEVGFYSAIFVLVALISWIFVRPTKKA